MYYVAYGEHNLSFELPEGVSGRVVCPDVPPVISDVDSAVRRGLCQPLNSAPLSELVHSESKVCLAITDASRACPLRLLLPPVLAELQHAGVQDKNITIVVATGLHRPSSQAEKEAMLGNKLLKQYRVIDHLATDRAQLSNLGQTQSGCPVIINKLAYETDLLVACGVVEPHQYAGYSGGSKTVAIGLAGEETIRFMHSIKMLEQSGVGVGCISGNPFRLTIDEIGRRAGLRFILNCVLDPEGCPVDLAAGEPGAVFNYLAEKSRQLSTINIKHPYKMVITGAGYPKGANLYQLSRAASYLAWRPKPVVVKGGLIILAARCEEGIGGGLAERGFYELMSQAENPAGIISRLKTGNSVPGGQRAYVMAQVLKHCRVILAGSRCSGPVKAVGFIPAKDMPQAFMLAQEMIGVQNEVLIVPQGMQTIVDLCN
jgi:nickel-dependent lactate racemase